MSVMSKFINLMTFIYLHKTHTELHTLIEYESSDVALSLEADFLFGRYRYKAATLWMCCRATIFILSSLSLILTRQKKKKGAR